MFPLLRIVIALNQNTFLIVCNFQEIYDIIYRKINGFDKMNYIIYIRYLLLIFNHLN